RQLQLLDLDGPVGPSLSLEVRLFESKSDRGTVHALRCTEGGRGEACLHFVSVEPFYLVIDCQLHVQHNHAGVSLVLMMLSFLSSVASSFYCIGMLPIRSPN
ncbi:unnamed protein product, partial [Phaeothamnion confervicola]